MSFADWKKRSRLLSYVDSWNIGAASKAAEAAYKAGEREGYKHAERVCRAAIELREQIFGNKSQ